MDTLAAMPIRAEKIRAELLNRVVRVHPGEALVRGSDHIRALCTPRPEPPTTTVMTCVGLVAAADTAQTRLTNGS